MSSSEQFASVVVLVLVLSLSAGCALSGDVKGDESLRSSSVYYGLVHTAAGKDGSVCLEQLADAHRGLRNRDVWAMKLMDASGAPASKLFWGNTYWLGSKGQCHAAGSASRAPVTPSPRGEALTLPSSQPPFPIRYYGAYFFHDSTMMMPNNFDGEYRITLGLCLPASCSEAEVANLLQEYFDSNVLFFQTLYNTTLKMESVKKIEYDYSWMCSRRFLSFVFAVSLTIALCILGTVYDIQISSMPVINEDTVIQNVMNSKAEILKNGDGIQPENYINDVVLLKKKQKKSSIYEKLLLCFSYKSNTELLFDTVIKEENKGCTPFFGLRVLMESWIIVNHLAVYSADSTHDRGFGFYLTGSTYMQIFVNSTYFVDTFITMSGFLLGYTFLDMETKKRPIGGKESALRRSYFVLLGILQRFIRLVPAYAVAIGVTEFTAKWRYRESISWSTERNDVYCEEFWWRNLLFINNLFPKREMCMTWSWFLSTDMQMFIVSLCLLVLSTSHFKFAVGIFGGLVMSTCIYVAYLTHEMNFVPYLDNMWKHFEVFYSPIWCRLSGYIIGLAGGYFIRHLNGKLPLRKMMIRICWSMSIAIMLTLLFAKADRNYSPVGSVLYMSLSRPAWSLAATWFLMACVAGHGGAVASFLSLKWWIPLARVTYCNYLLNPLLITLTISFLEAGRETSIPASIIFGIGIVVVSFMLSIFFSLTFETPLIRAFKIMLEKYEQKEKPVEINKTASCKKD